MEQLKKTPTFISSLKILKLSLTHREILEKALEASVPNDLDPNQFQAMVGKITTNHHLVFSKKDLSQKLFHNQVLYIEVGVHENIAERVLIDNSVGLNICTLKFMK